jgi:hypothetical protein
MSANGMDWLLPQSWQVRRSRLNLQTLGAAPMTKTTQTEQLRFASIGLLPVQWTRT